MTPGSSHGNFPRPRHPSDKLPRRRRRTPGLRTDWTPVADWYDQLVGDAGDDYQQKVVIPGVMRLLGAGPNDHVLDVACGQGVLCRHLRFRGVEVTGVDASAKLIELARERSDRAIRFLVADARDLAGVGDLADNYFHAAACVLSIQDLDPLEPVFAGVAKKLQPWGRFVLAMTHPCFRVPRGASWGWDEKARRQYRRIDAYLSAVKEKIVTHPGRGDSPHTWTFHRPLGQYVKALSRAGLLVDALEEWPSHKRSDSGPRAAAENLARREIPLFLALRAVKKP